MKDPLSGAVFPNKMKNASKLRRGGGDMRVGNRNANAMDDQQDPQDPKSSLFPLFPAAGTGAVTATATATTAATVTSTSMPQWLCNPSFTSDLSLINDAVSSLPRSLNVIEEDEEEEEAKKQQQEKNHHSYELLEEEEEEEEKEEDSDGENYDERKMNKKKKKCKKKNKKRKISKEIGDSKSKSIHAKDYYFDSHPDPDNLTYGSLYRFSISLFIPLSFCYFIHLLFLRVKLRFFFF